VLIDPADELEATERIHAFWGLLMLNNLWVAASGLPSRIPGHIIEVFTPWPTVSLEISIWPNLMIFHRMV
jgi:hypothetical protein